MNRRHLSREQKRALVAESLRADPGLSNREHARRTGVDKNTVKSVRDGLVAGGEIHHLDERTGPDGKSYPASQPSRPEPEPEPEPPAPSWEPAGQLRPADLAALNNEKKSIFLPKPTPEPDDEPPSWEPADTPHAIHPRMAAKAIKRNA